MLHTGRGTGDQVPVILITVNDLEINIVSGLEAGVNDYITKPFSMMVLCARVFSESCTAGLF